MATTLRSFVPPVKQILILVWIARFQRSLTDRIGFRLPTSFLSPPKHKRRTIIPSASLQFFYFLQMFVMDCCISVNRIPSTSTGWEGDLAAFDATSINDIPLCLPIHLLFHHPLSCSDLHWWINWWARQSQFRGFIPPLANFLVVCISLALGG